MTGNPAYLVLIRADLQAAAQPEPMVTRMFGGRALMLGPHMVASVHPDHVLYRCGRGGEAAALALAGVDPAQMGGRVMAGYVRAGPAALAQGATRAALLDLALREIGRLQPR